MMPDPHYLDPAAKLLVIIGPSASGKTFLVQQLVADGTIELTRSWTTRPRRMSEEDAGDHIFVSESKFQQQAKNGFFLEKAQLFGLKYSYGLPRAQHNDPTAIPAVVLRSMVLPLLHRHYSSPIIYQIESPRSIVEERIVSRGGEARDIAKRLALYDEELRVGREAADRIFVNDAQLIDLQQRVTAALTQDFA